MENKKLIFVLGLGGAIRIALLLSKYQPAISDRVEIATPLNSFKRVQEGVYLLSNKIDPYNGDMIHESPIILLALAWILTNASHLIGFLYIALDLLTASTLYKMSKIIIYQMYLKQSDKLENSVANIADLRLQLCDTITIPKFVLIAYLFNPLSVLNCVGLTSTVFSNAILAFSFYFLVKEQALPCLLLISLETIRNLYPVVLIAPAVLILGKGCTKASIRIVCIFTFLIISLVWINFLIMGNMTFLNGTLGFVFFCRELQPNIGLFWYFFMEMFDHFRTLFLITFQMNATVLYFIPLTLKLRKDPVMLATVLIFLASIFRSYPCLGDISFYLAFLPLWKQCWKFMAHNFVVFCFFVITTLIMPAIWHLWMHAGSANANFYFGATLAFSTGQIFLLTDLLFAYVKNQFCSKHGQKVYINGKEAKIILE